MLQRWRARWDGMLASRRFSQQRARLAVDGGCTIVAYHGVAPRSSGRLNTKTISSALFEQHLRLLCRYATPIRLREAEIGSHASGRLRVALTFDDGLASVARYGVSPSSSSDSYISASASCSSDAPLSSGGSVTFFFTVDGEPKFEGPTKIDGSLLSL